MKTVKHNELLRLQLNALLNDLEQARQMLPNHMPSFGSVAESILKNHLTSFLPQKVSVCQGFVECNGEVSNQCDIILYNANDFAPIYSYGDIKVINHQAVYAVIEVKTGIDSRRFCEVLHGFERLTKLCVQNKFLFIYEGCTITTLKNYFHCKQSPYYSTILDKDDFEALPDAIISLKHDYYLAKDHIQTERNDMFGYMAYYAIDHSNKAIACLQGFTEKLLSIVSVESKPVHILNNDNPQEPNYLLINDGFYLVEM